MTPLVLTDRQRAAVRDLLCYAWEWGQTGDWAEGKPLEVTFFETEYFVPIVIALQEIEGLYPELLTILQEDPVVRFESQAPNITITLSARIHDLLKEGYFNGFD